MMEIAQHTPAVRSKVRAAHAGRELLLESTIWKTHYVRRKLRSISFNDRYRLRTVETNHRTFPVTSREVTEQHAIPRGGPPGKV